MNRNSLASRAKQLLWLHYTAPLSTMFRQFRAGVIYFAVGLMTVLMANTYMPPSLGQEVIVLLGLILGGFGFILAMLAQVRMIIARILRFFSR